MEGLYSRKLYTMGRIVQELYSTLGEAVFYSRKQVNSTKNYIVERTGRGCIVELYSD